MKDPTKEFISKLKERCPSPNWDECVDDFRLYIGQNIDDETGVGLFGMYGRNYAWMFVPEELRVMADVLDEMNKTQGEQK